MATSRDSEVDLMADVGNRRTPSRPTYESVASPVDSLSESDFSEETESVKPLG